MEFVLLKSIDIKSVKAKKFSQEDAVKFSYSLCEKYKDVLTPEEFVNIFIREKLQMPVIEDISDWNAVCSVLAKTLTIKFSARGMSIN